MTDVYVRRAGGKIDGVFGGPQPGYADELLPDDNVEVLAFLNPSPPPTIDGAVFLSRITDAEYTAVTTSTNVGVLRWVETLRMKGVVNLGDATAIAAKAGLVALGLMTQARADTVFAP